MATTETAADRQAITATVQEYIEGASSGDAAKLKEAFHPEAWMFGSVSGQRMDMPITQMIDLAVAQPLGTGGAYEARITSVEQEGDAATVRLEETGAWGGVSFVDFFSLAQIDGSWKIVGKTFAHTGGELPAG
jgi:Putative lumazine-binding